MWGEDGGERWRLIPSLRRACGAAGEQNPLPPPLCPPLPLRGLAAFIIDIPGGALYCSDRTPISGFSVSLFLQTGKGGSGSRRLLWGLGRGGGAQAWLVSQMFPVASPSAQHIPQPPGSYGSSPAAVGEGMILHSTPSPDTPLQCISLRLGFPFLFALQSWGTF